MKRILSFILIAVLAVTALSSCKKEEEKDYYMIGYDAVEAGDYEKALENFRLAAKEGDDQAEKAAKIVSCYLDAAEAFAIGDVESAKNFLNEIPSDYKYYDIADDVNELKRKVYSYSPDTEDEEAKEDEKKEDKPSEETEDAVETAAEPDEFTAQEAMAYVSAKYGVVGDLGEGLEPSYTEDGEIYYEVVADVGKDGESDVKTLRIYSDGTIKEQA